MERKHFEKLLASVRQMTAIMAGKLTPSRLLYVGKCVCELSNVKYAQVNDIECANWSAYSTCRGNKPKAELTRIIDVICDESGRYPQDERNDAVNDGIWDWVCHQYTFYSVTPLFLDHLLGIHTASRIQNRDLLEFIKLCKEQGTGAIYLTAAEIAENRRGTLPIFRIEDVLKKHDPAD